jgi:CheY-like chemotaxis protein
VSNILVVDDDDNMRVLIRTILERRGHRISEAKDGLEGLARFEQTLPDLVVTDIVMPGVGGVALLNELQRRPAPPKVLLVSGKRSLPEGEWSALATRGLVGFLPKPFLPTELVTAIEALLGAPAEGRQTA